MILGMIPMSLGLGEGGEQNAPLGRAVIGGLLLATATTLFFVPVMYSILRRKDLEPVSEEDADLLFEKEEPEYQLAMKKRGGNRSPDAHNGDHEDGRRPVAAGQHDGADDGNTANGSNR